MQQAFVVVKSVPKQSDNKKILLLKRSKNDTNRPGQWDLPGGWVDNGEDYIGAAIRETQEEAGITVDRNNLDLAFTLTEMTERGNTNWLFYMTQVSQTKIVLSKEHDDFYWATESEALEMITYERQHKAVKHIMDNKLLE